MNQINIGYFKTQFGELLLGAFKDKLCICDWRYRKMREAVDNRIQTGLQANYVEAESTVTEEAKKQLSEYFSEERKEFNVPLLLVGTEFQKSVWDELLKIPFGVTDTYLGLSIKLHNPKSIRAVAAANGANALSIFVPCHRIIGSNGELIGYAGGLPTKNKLLNLENKHRTQQLNLF